MTFDPKDPIDVTNAQSIDDFIQYYISTGNEWKTWAHPLTKEEYQIECQKAEDLSKEQLDTCFELIKFTSLDHYKKSKDGWKPRKKMNEMKLLDLKYLLVKRADQVEGFISIMPTYEDDYPVIYIYEIHLSESLQGTGLGRLLMSHVEAIASKVPSVEKIMLTCFLANERAVKFYEKVGFTKDEFSPPPKQLRNGALVEADYVILSKAVKSAT